jgi:hypothetical protein
LREDFSFARFCRAPVDEREPNHQQAPRRELMEKMWQIKKDRLRSMNAFGKSAGELVHDNLIIKFRHGEDAADHPQHAHEGRRGQHGADRNLSVGHIEVQFVAAPMLFAALTAIAMKCVRSTNKPA